MGPTMTQKSIAFDMKKYVCGSQVFKRAKSSISVLNVQGVFERNRPISKSNRLHVDIFQFLNLIDHCIIYKFFQNDQQFAQNSWNLN